MQGRQRLTSGKKSAPVFEEKNRGSSAQVKIPIGTNEAPGSPYITEDLSQGVQELPTEITRRAVWFCGAKWSDAPGHTSCTLVPE